LEKLRRNGFGNLLNLLNVKETTEQDTYRVSLYIETKKMELAKFEREEEYLCQTKEK